MGIDTVHGPWFDVIAMKYFDTFYCAVKFLFLVLRTRNIMRLIFSGILMLLILIVGFTKRIRNLHSMKNK